MRRNLSLSQQPVSLLEWQAYVARVDISVPGNRIQMIEGRLVLIEYR